MLIGQQVRLKNHAEKKQRLENKKFEKAIKAFRQKEKHQEKKQNVE